MRIYALCALVLPLAAGPVSPPPSDWPSYGRDPGGSRYSPLTRIDRDNVARLEVAWTFHTGEAGVVPRRGRPPALEATPLVISGTMYLSTPLGRAIALDPATGRERWRHDPGVDPEPGYGDFASPGVSYWRGGPRPAGRGRGCPRHLARWKRGPHRRGERVVGDRRRSRARPRLPAHLLSRARLLRRNAEGREPVRELDRRPSRLHGKGRMALPDR